MIACVGHMYDILHDIGVSVIPLFIVYIHQTFSISSIYFQCIFEMEMYGYDSQENSTVPGFICHTCVCVYVMHLTFIHDNGHACPTFAHIITLHRNM